MQKITIYRTDGVFVGAPVGPVGRVERTRAIDAKRFDLQEATRAGVSGSHKNSPDLAPDSFSHEHVPLEPILGKPGYHTEIFFHQSSKMAVGYNGSALSGRALAAASHFSFLYQSELTVCTISEKLISDEEKNTLEARVNSFFEPTPGVSTHDHALKFYFAQKNDVSVGLGEAAKGFHVDWLFVGCHGKNTIDALEEGSVSYELILNCPSSLMLVHPESKVAGFKHILVPFDGSDFSLKALRRALALSHLTHARISVVHVAEAGMHAAHDNKIERELQAINWQGASHDYKNISGTFGETLKDISEEVAVDIIFIGAPPHVNESLASHHSHAFELAQKTKALLGIVRN